MTGHCAYFDSANCKRWQTGCYDCPLLGTYPRAKRDNSPYNYKTKRKVFTSLGEKLHLVPVSNWLAEIVQESFLKESHVSVIHNGINVEAFTPCDSGALCAKYDIAGKRVVLGVASPWSRRKGLHDFYKLHTLLPRDKYQIVLVGLSQQQIAELPEGIIALQRTHSVEELAQWYSLADVFLNATYEDNYPTTNLEAISCGTPVITYRTGGSPESVTPQTGRVVEQGDLDGVVKAIEELCAEDRDEMCKRCREYAIEHFDRDKNFEKYIDLYEELLEQ
jgi:glycosyltransferase involved in cell wall biosynthesis